MDPKIKRREASLKANAARKAIAEYEEKTYVEIFRNGSQLRCVTLKELRAGNEAEGRGPVLRVSL